MTQKAETIPVDAILFEDIIDGYFPLQESLRQMLVRNGFASACVTLSHAPIMDIPGLSADAPVPLRLTQGTAGSADRLDIIVSLDGTEPRVSGAGKWHWYADERAQEKLLSPFTRLAEPAIVQGVGLIAGHTPTQSFGQVAVLDKSDFAIFRGQGPDLQKTPDATMWGNSSQSNEIHREVVFHHHGLFETPAIEFEQNLKQHRIAKLPTPMFTEVLVRL